VRRASGFGLVRRDDEFDLESVGILQVSGQVFGAAGVRVAVGEHQFPAVLGRRGDQAVEVGAVGEVEREVVQAGPEPVVLRAGARGRGLDDQVGRAQAPAAPVRPVLERGVAQLAEQSAEAVRGALQVGDPEFDVVQCSGHGSGHGDRLCE
jgi:hypothetical protein